MFKYTVCLSPRFYQEAPLYFSFSSLPGGEGWRREVVRVVPCSLPRDAAPESQVPMLSGVPLLVARTRNRIPLALGHEGPVCHLSLRLEGAAMSSYMFNMHRASPIVSCSGFYSPRFRPVRLPFPVDFRRFFSFPFSFFNASFYSS